jgi:outer membrane protein
MKRRRPTLSLGTILVVLLPACVALAQKSTPQPETLTLHQAMSLALENHPSLRASDANVRSSSAAVTQAVAGYLPSLSLTASTSRTDGAFVFNPSFPARLQSYNSISTGLQLQQMLFDFGRTGGRVSANQHLEEAATLDYTTARENVTVNVQQAYFDLLQAQKVEAVNEEAVQLATANLARARAFYSVGRRPQLDVTKAEVDLANANVNLIRARNQLHITGVQLENAIGIHPAGGFAVSDTFEVSHLALGLDSAMATALDQRPDLRSAQARVHAARSFVSAAWAQNLPILSASGTWTWSGFNLPLSSRWNAGVTLSLPLFQGFAISGQVNQAEADADAAQASLDLLKEAVILDVQQSYWGVREAEERIAAATKLVEQAEQNLVLSEKQYAAGVGIALDVTDARLSLSNARITEIQALYDYNSSLLRLRRSVGTIGQE